MESWHERFKYANIIDCEKTFGKGGGCNMEGERKKDGKLTRRRFFALVGKSAATFTLGS
ncbi:MAG: hypothetical protein OGMRLDGQ_003319, partial [Candidatus Fervidibacter sp.]